MSTRAAKNIPMAHLNIRMSTGLRAAIQRKADQLGMSVAEYIRTLMQRDILQR